MGVKPEDFELLAENAMKVRVSPRSFLDPAQI